LGRELPISYVEKVIREKESFRRLLSKEEAVQAAMELAREDVKKNIPTDAKIDEEILLHEKVENGKVKLTIHFQVIENIAKEKPITRGD
jgi:similar to stage IV sporulation protein